jgi:hypothetical protein
MALIRETMRHLVEEGLLEGAKAGQIVEQAADTNMPEADSSGRHYDMGREYLQALAKGFRAFPPYPESGHGERGRR